MASNIVTLKKGEWVQIDPAGASVTQITHKSGECHISYVEAVNKPANLSPATPVSDITNTWEKLYFYNMIDGEFIWACSNLNDAEITVTKGK